MSIRVSYVMIFVSDMSSSVAFYRDVLGLPLRFESPGWSEFATEGATLALHAADGGGSSGAGEGEGLPAGRCRPGLRVPDLDAFHARMLEHEVVCVQEPEEVFGARVAQYLDPDGVAISVSDGGGGTEGEGE